MNKRNCSGGIKFRELDYSKSPRNQTNKNKIRSRDDVLKLFNDSIVNKDKNNSQTEEIKLSKSLENLDKEESNCNEKSVNNSFDVNSCTKSKFEQSTFKPNEEKIVEKVTTDENICTSISSSNIRIYNVLIGKISTRKHKQWDSDGLLQVDGSSAILKNTDNKIIGRSNVKLEELEEGYRMIIGGKEIEIVDLRINEDTPLVQKSSQEKENTKFCSKTVQFKPFKSLIKKDGLIKKEENKFLNPNLAVKSLNNTNKFNKKNKLESNKNKFSDESSTEIVSSSTNIHNKRTYNVMVGKISTRKHKQWDSDGLLTIDGNIAVLKGMDNKVIGKTSIKHEQIEEGYRMCIGGKEIEIIDLKSCEDTEDTQSNQTFNAQKLEPPNKKFKTNSGFISLKSAAFPSLHFNSKPLIMPQPPIEIEWANSKETKQIHEVSVDGCLTSVLRPHQREGVVFLYKCVMGMNDSNYNGAILADEMGLGKTLQCISLIWTLLKKGPYGKPVLKRVLIVTPSSLCGNWNKEFKNWLGSIKISPFVVEGKNKVKDFLKTPRATVMIVSYEMFVRNFDDVKTLNFELLICDEGHRLKNSEVKALKSLDELNCRRRILLTGTPVQNQLKEFYTLVNFVNPGILGSLNEFKKHYEEKIVAGQNPNADEDELNLSQERAEELHERTKSFILRRTNNIINKFLPKKHELVIFFKPTSVQCNLYSIVTDYWFNRSVMNDNVMPLTIITALKKICNHPYLFTSERSNILDEVLPTIKTDLTSTSYSPSHSSKILAIQGILQTLKPTQEKLVIISYFTQTLNLLENICSKESYTFFRLDGSTPNITRTKIVEQFNSKNNNNRIFLLSAKAGGVGLNLIGASRLILFDSDWNPANDLQAMARIWRDGQKRSVYIYRFLTTGTIEEKIYQRQISKTGLSEAVVDANHISSLKLSKDELKDLFTLDDKTSSVTHDLMECSCNGEGEIPIDMEIEENQEDSRDCQFEIKEKNVKQQISINQLKSWQHFKNPINDTLTKDLMLEQVSKYITFIFKNSVEN